MGANLGKIPAAWRVGLGLWPLNGRYNVSVDVILYLTDYRITK